VEKKKGEEDQQKPTKRGTKAAMATQTIPLNQIPAVEQQGDDAPGRVTIGQVKTESRKEKEFA